MDEFNNVAEETQAFQKPSLSRRRIAGEILSGMAVGIFAGLLGGFGFLLLPYDRGGFNGMLALAAVIENIFPAVYGPASAAGVYLIGRKGKQTGSFLLTLGCGFAGWIVVMGMRRLVRSFYWSYWLPFISDWAFVPLLLIIPPLLATLGFNLTRRYKEAPSA